MTSTQSALSPRWTRIAARSDLGSGERKVVRANGKQLLILDTPSGLFIVNNRCPHEGFPLSEGTVGEGAVLTCNWHNWKFNLLSGETLVGGDCLRQYPIEIRGDEIWADLADPPVEEILEGVVTNLTAAYDDYDYTRIARELARLHRAAGSTEDALRRMLHITRDRFEYGMSHAHAAAADWLSFVRSNANDERDSLAAMLEIHAHFAFDTQRMDRFAFTEEIWPFDEAGFIEAIENEDENAAIAMARDALRSGMSYKDLRPALARAALAHYAGFGHSAIYVVKAGDLIDELGPQVTQDVLFALIRSLIYASREDLIPEFRCYAPARKAWTGTGDARLKPEDFKGKNQKAALDLVNSASGDIPALYDALFGALCWNLLHYDIAIDSHTDLSISHNITWLDFTHGVTFSNAVRRICEETPSLWPGALLQMALFAGRNARFTTENLEADWTVRDEPAFWEETADILFDHGQHRHIVAAHLVKLREAARGECEAAPEAPSRGGLLAALNRFYHSPMRHRHMRRTASQAWSFVQSED